MQMRLDVVAQPVTRATAAAKDGAADGSEIVDPLRDPRPVPAAELMRSIQSLDQALFQRLQDRVVPDTSLSRAAVSFQASKQEPGYRWYKYKEAFSPILVRYFLERFQLRTGLLLDPFAGSGTALFAASNVGLEAHGVEILPVAQELIKSRLFLQTHFNGANAEAARHFLESAPWKSVTTDWRLPTLRITRNAYPPETAAAIERYVAAAREAGSFVKHILFLALLCVLESVSYTRKDGQYLRWDERSGRSLGSKRFSKGQIPDFDTAVIAKVSEILHDLANRELGRDTVCSGNIILLEGSSLDALPSLPSDAYDIVFTSPPYCNRYDYTRTYALELALLGLGEQDVGDLRQAMLTCTVENRAKDLLKMNPNWQGAVAAADGQPLLQAILRYLDSQRDAGALNNVGIARMVRGYFGEMACLVWELARVVKPRGKVLMVNDNVRYAGASISVDLILSAIAEELGFVAESILVLPTAKGNSSQQMGQHGRDSLRKCVYVWRKP